MNGQDIVNLGYPEGPLISLALEVAYQVIATHPEYATNPAAAERAAGSILARILNDPTSVTPDAPDAQKNLAQALAQHNKTQTETTLHEQPIPFQINGAELIDPKAIEQMRNAMRLPVTLAGFLAPDAHHGYGLPIGGVWATDNTISPYAVGVDIGCRMQLTTFDLHPDELPLDALEDAILKHTIFGSGGAFQGAQRNHDDVLDSTEWHDHPFLKRNPKLRDTAAAQLGTSGGGNHFINAGRLTTPDGTTRLAIMTHSGSRGLGARIANHYSQLAQEQHPKLDTSIRHLAWFDLTSQEGQEYWRGMQLAGAYAAANHNAIHNRITRHLNLAPIDQVSNFHNFAWLEDIQTHTGETRRAVVHRKGATPAAQGVRGIIPGSMATPAVLVTGLGNQRSLNSASHGSGRAMSRKQAKETLAGRNLQADMAALGIRLIGAGLDEAPEAYKHINDVLEHQQDLIKVEATFEPMIVRMAS